MAGPLAEELDDPDLVRRCLDGDPLAFEALVRRYRRLVYSVPARMRLPPEEADEVFQETFATLLDKMATIKDRARIGLWLAVTARRKALDRIRRGPARREVDLGETHEVRDEREPAIDALIRLERQAAIRVALARLGERCRQLLQALYYEDPTPAYAEIARRLGVPVGSLGPTRMRCFEKLRRELAQGAS